ncbi:MAG: hypothetical protein L0Z48_10670 [candidate division Zixibacteria bacterium]|nr:hypothetical protein [candidate division Zixibacteria bacterium]
MDRPEIVHHLERKGEYRLAHRIAYCRKRVFVMKCRSYFENAVVQHDEELRLPYSCHTSACPECSKIYAEKKVKEYLSYLEGFQIPKGYFWQFGTLTKKVRFGTSGERELPEPCDLVEFFKQVRQFVNEFFPRRERVERRCEKNCRNDHFHLAKDVYQNSYCGALGVLEIGKGRNVHVHLLVMGPVYSHSSMAQRWKKITGDSYILKFEPVRATLVAAGEKVNFKAAVGEVLKYIRKPVMFDSYEATAEMLILFKGFRRLHTFGIFYNPRSTGGIIEGWPHPEKHAITCGHCQKTFLFYRFDDENLWWDEKTFRRYYALDG